MGPIRLIHGTYMPHTWDIHASYMGHTRLMPGRKGVGFWLDTESIMNVFFVFFFALPELVPQLSFIGLKESCKEKDLFSLS